MDTYPLNAQNPSEWNRYPYTANNPVNAVDPSGLTALVGTAAAHKPAEIARPGLVVTGLAAACVYRLTTSLFAVTLENVILGGTIKFSTIPCDFEREPASCDDDPFDKIVKCEEVERAGYFPGRLSTAFNIILREMRARGHNTKGVSMHNRDHPTRGPCVSNPQDKAFHANVRKGKEKCGSIGQCACCKMINEKPKELVMCKVLSRTYSNCQ